MRKTIRIRTNQGLENVVLTHMKIPKNISQGGLTVILYSHIVAEMRSEDCCGEDQ
jgi:hypothetical protein